MRYLDYRPLSVEVLRPTGSNVSYGGILMCAIHGSKVAVQGRKLLFATTVVNSHLYDELSK